LTRALDEYEAVALAGDQGWDAGKQQPERRSCRHDDYVFGLQVSGLQPVFGAHGLLSGWHGFVAGLQLDGLHDGVG
jgi:hypothetical protein